jgi:DNA-directed RNA polymerase I, II, and III subunit RPABC1
MILEKIKKQRWKMYLIYKCIYELLIDRNYSSITDVPSYDEFVNHFCNENDLIPSKNSLTFVAVKNKKSIDSNLADFKKSIDSNLADFKASTLIYFLDDDSVGIKHMVKVYDLMISKNIKHCILVYDQSVTFSAKKYVQTKNKEIQVEFFCHDELLINKTRHSHSPKYQIVTSSELKKYNIDEDEKIKLPKILSNDHISKYFGLKRGDLIKIVRSSETVGEYTTFRICC